jgi:hypothetical protein
MITVNLTEAEQWFLVETLMREVVKLRDEIRENDDYDCGGFLKERERFIGNLLHKLREDK